MTVEAVPAELCQAAARLARVVERALGEVELTLPQYRLLGFLALGPEAAAALADKLTVSRPTITAVVDGLVAAGLVARQRTEVDRRRVDHTLTPAGQAALERADKAVGERLASLLAVLPPERQASAVDGLEALRAALDVERHRRLGTA